TGDLPLGGHQRRHRRHATKPPLTPGHRHRRRVPTDTDVADRALPTRRSRHDDVAAGALGRSAERHPDDPARRPPEASTMIRFGLQGSAQSPDGLPDVTYFRDVAHLVEESEFDSIWVGDHLSFGNPILDPFVA